MESILPSIITGVLALIGIIITNLMSNKQIENKLVTAQAVTDTKIEALTEEVKKHNNFATRVPVMEANLQALEHRIKTLESAKK